MKNKMRVFIGANVTRLKEVVYYHSYVTEFDHNHNYNRDYNLMKGAVFESHKGQSAKIVDNLESFVNWLENGGSYRKEPIFFTDFLGLIDEATPIKAYFNRMLALGAEIFYFAERDSNIERIKSCGLPTEIYRREGI